MAVLSRSIKMENKKRFELTKTPSGMWCIAKECTADETYFLKRAMNANSMNDDFYRKRQQARPFFQSGSTTKAGYCLIEFWTDDVKAVNTYITWLNSVYDKTVSYAKSLFNGELP